MTENREYAKYICTAIEKLKPPENLTVSEWAEKYRLLGVLSAHMPGPWRNTVTPYLVGIMDEICNPISSEVIFCKPTQVGGTEAILNSLGYIIMQDPSPTLVIYPSDKLAEEISSQRIKPMILDSPELAKRFDKNGSSVLELNFDDMYIALTGANSPSSLASKPIRFLFLDEIDKYPSSTKKEADPVALATERTKTFANRKIFKTSTPTLRTGYIWEAAENAEEMRHYFMPCPHCGEYIEFKFPMLKFPEKDESISISADIERRSSAALYYCEECGSAITDYDKAGMLKKGEWRKVRGDNKAPRSVAFHLNTLYSPFVRFADVAKEFLLSKDDPERLHNFVNSWLAEPWEDTRLKTSSDLVLDRQTDVPEFEVPEWAKLITGGVDVQETSLYWTIRAWGDGLTSQCIAHGQALSGEEVERAMNAEYRKSDGTAMLVCLALVDSGDQTDDVYDFCARNAEWALPAKGTDSGLSHYKISSVNRAGAANGMRLVLVDGGKYKDMIAARMAKPNGRGSWMVYRGCDEEYAEQVTAEHKVVVKSGTKELLRWVPKVSHADNHYLDAEVYCACAADIMGVRTLHLQSDGEGTQASVPEADSQTTNADADSWINKNGGEWI